MRQSVILKNAIDRAFKSDHRRHQVLQRRKLFIAIAAFVHQQIFEFRLIIRPQTRNLAYQFSNIVGGRCPAGVIQTIFPQINGSGLLS